MADYELWSTVEFSYHCYD